MKLPFRRLLLSALLALAHVAVFAQGWAGINASNYGGTNSVYVNPSAIADSRYKVYVNLLGANLNFYNSYLGFEAPYTLWQVARDKVPNQYRNSNGDVIFSENYLRETVNGNPKFMNLSAELRLPSILVSLGSRHSLALTNRVRLIAQANNVSESIVRLSRYGLGKADSLGLAQKILSDNQFAVNLSNYHEFAATYARVMSKNPEHFIKAGATVKYLVGLGGGYVVNEGLTYQVYNRDSIQLQNRNLGYGYTDYEYYDRDDFSVGGLYGKDKLGSGFGFDIGATYEWRPDHDGYSYHMDNQDWVDHSQNKYKLRVGLSLMDIGSVKYDNKDYVGGVKLANTNTVQLGSLDTLNFDNLRQLDQTVDKLLKINNSFTSFKTKLPATVMLTADYKLLNRVYVGAAWTQSLISKYAIGTRTFSSINVTPRFETRLAEVSFPLILGNEYEQFQIGSMVRLGPVFVGSDNLGGLFGATDLTGFDVYFGAAFMLHKKKHKDKDRDQVSNKYDKCRDVKGTWAMKGCPDRDGDLVGDEVDDCPDEPGLATLKGCPDKDGDGVTDKIDDCPDVPGLATLKGCPDRDLDTVPDKDDKCPDVPGPADHFGCPDTDGDGLYDFEDSCITEAGPAENKGCPYKDTDGDGLLDKDDSCPTVAGPTENKGCPWPDTDGDTVLDKDDECPKTPGPVENKGCPILKKEEAKVLKTAFSNLEFETNKDVIKKTSYPSLDELANLMKEKPAFRLRLSGHTDNVGKPEYNMTLSRKRANAVKTYLVKKGVEEERIEVLAFGRTKPIASNKTAAGRAKNRRVEMKVLFE